MAIRHLEQGGDLFRLSRLLSDSSAQTIGEYLKSFTGREEWRGPGR